MTAQIPKPKVSPILTAMTNSNSYLAANSHASSDSSSSKNSLSSSLSSLVSAAVPTTQPSQPITKFKTALKPAITQSKLTEAIAPKNSSSGSRPSSFLLTLLSPSSHLLAYPMAWTLRHHSNLQTHSKRPMIQRLGQEKLRGLCVCSRKLTRLKIFLPLMALRPDMTVTIPTPIMAAQSISQSVAIVQTRNVWRRSLNQFHRHHRYHLIHRLLLKPKAPRPVLTPAPRAAKTLTSFPGNRLVPQGLNLKNHYRHLLPSKLTQ